MVNLRALQILTDLLFFNARMVERSCLRAEVNIVKLQILIAFSLLTKTALFEIKASQKNLHVSDATRPFFLRMCIKGRVLSHSRCTSLELISHVLLPLEG